LTDFSKTIQISNFLKVRPVGAQLLHADGWADMTNLIVAFRNFAKVLKTAHTTTTTTAAAAAATTTTTTTKQSTVTKATCHENVDH